MPFLLILFVIFFTGLNAQDAPYRSGELLLQFEKNTELKNWEWFKSIEGAKLKVLDQDWNLYVLEFDSLKYSADVLLKNFQKDKTVRFAQYNHILSLRNLPDDPKYDQWQWNLELLGLPTAWEYSTGGLTAVGDSIVVAVIDGGCDLGHEDLSSNIWKNWDEIPGDSIDNDGNGYNDDFFGWQVVNENDQHDANSHGTSVSGIIGAVGNNGVGMSGINWNLKMMQISAQEQDLLLESNIIKAYRYVLDQRRMYRLTAGEKGAFVVVVNLSAGVDYGKAQDFPIWCAIYDSLGAEGILSVGAVMNNNINVDNLGDMPTVCPSPFHIAVTNTTRYDALDPNAAYGKVHVDIAAPGAVYSTRPANTYNVFGGTSGAAPHVTAAIALLSAFPDQRWTDFLKTESADAAIEIRNMLILGADDLTVLDGKTSSGGRLNIGKSMQILNQRQAIPENALSVQPWVEGQLLLKFNIKEPGDYVYDIFDVLGRLHYRGTLSAPQADIYSIFLDWELIKKEMIFIRLSTKAGKRLGVVKF